MSLNNNGNKNISYNAKYVWQINRIMSDVINVTITVAPGVSK